MLLLRPFKVPHPLFSVIAQLVDIHHASVPHYMGSIDKVAWESKIQAVKVVFSHLSKVERRCSCSFRAGRHQRSSSWSLWSANWIGTVGQQYLLIFVVLEFLLCEFGILVQSVQLVLLDFRERNLSQTSWRKPTSSLSFAFFWFSSTEILNSSKSISPSLLVSVLLKT